MLTASQQHIHIYCPIEKLTWPAATSSSGAVDLQASRFQLSFEQALERLEVLPRMFIELDGSFVWSGQDEGARWQIDGMLYDRQGRLQRVELTGHAARNVWEQLLNVFGQPLDEFAIHCLRHQRFIDAAEFLSRQL